MLCRAPVSVLVAERISWGRWSAGALEYVSLLTGYRALLLIADGLYALAMVLPTRFRLLGDRALETADVGPDTQRATAAEGAG